MSVAQLSRRERLLARLQSESTAPKRSLGQNFLVSDQVIEKILFVVQAQSFSALVEVGPGLGALTDDLLQIAVAAGVKINLVELDAEFAQHWRTFAAASVFEADALQLEWQSLQLPDGALLVSNLPYQISSSLVIDRCLEPVGINRMILMFQKEVAQRLVARAGTPEYGLLTVMAQAFWEISTVCDAGPKDFYPPPKVASRVLQFRLRKSSSDESVALNERAKFLKFVKAAFAHRRKLMSRNLQSGFLGRCDLAQVEKTFSDHGLKPTARAEELSPSQFIRLYHSFANGGAR